MAFGIVKAAAGTRGTALGPSLELKGRISVKFDVGLTVKDGALCQVRPADLKDTMLTDVTRGVHLIACGSEASVYSSTSLSIKERAIKGGRVVIASGPPVVFENTLMAPVETSY